jgi:chaperonin cofactor prefoldin
MDRHQTYEDLAHQVEFLTAKNKELVEELESLKAKLNNTFPEQRFMYVKG